MLLNHLGVQNGCQIVFDSSDAMECHMDDEDEDDDAIDLADLGDVGGALPRISIGAGPL